MHLISPTTDYNNTCEILSTREAQQRLSSQTFYWGLVTYASTRYVTKVQTLRKKAGVQDKPHGLNKRYRYSEPFLSGNGGNPSQNPGPQILANQPCKQAFLKIAVSDLKS